MWERVQRNGEKKEERYAFKVLLFSLSTEVETTTARNTEAVLLANRESQEKGPVSQLVGLL